MLRSAIRLQPLLARASTVRLSTSVTPATASAASIRAATAAPYARFDRRGFAASSAAASASAPSASPLPLSSIPDATTQAVTDIGASELMADLPIDSTTVTEAAMKIGDLKAMGLGSGYLGLFEQALEAVHVTTGLPWWATIATLTATIRFAVFPLVINTQRASAQMRYYAPEIEEFKKAAKIAVEKNDPKAKALIGLSQLRFFNLIGASMLGPLKIAAVQGVLGISMFFALERMAHHPVPQLQNGGALWFTDLTISDPMFILPCASALGVLAMIEFGVDSTAKLPPHMKWVFRFVTPISMFIMAKLPAAVLVYFTTMTSISIIQNVIFHAPAFRKAIGVKLPVDGRPIAQDLIDQAIADSRKVLDRPSTIKLAEKPQAKDAEPTKSDSDKQ
ncbi:hypothetical protein GQ42DRAFT_165163 [Ramicandelaber brevisporus]|nr:hypothetical protein GQ42DRAFT_165163 [Ramicandelaber brevisporus]